MNNTPCMLLPVPRRLEMTGGTCLVPQTPFAYADDGNLGVITHELGVQAAPQPQRATFRFYNAAGAPAELRRDSSLSEGYALRIASDGVDVWAADEAGRFYAAMTLRQLLKQYGCRLPCMAAGDAPVLRRRGVQVCFPQGHTEYRRAYYHHLVPWLARWKINELYLYIESYFDFPSLPHMAGPGAMTPADARDLDALCRAHHISLIPMLNTLGHCGELLATQRYQHLSEYKPPEHARMVRPFNLCASSREVYRLIDGMLDDLMACFSAPTLHIGGDEVSCIGECPRCKRAAPDLSAFGRYAQYYGRILDRLKAKGRQGGIWGDMLLHYSEELSEPERKKLFAPWREKNAIIYDWHYSGGGQESLERFVGAGLETIACSSTSLCYASSLWPAQRVNQRDLYADAVQTGATGGLTTDWGNFTGMHHEQFNYLHASGGTLLWSGADGEQLAPGLTLARFEQAWAFHRYGLRSKTLAAYLHTLGDAKGAVLEPLPTQGHGLRKCLYHTVNPLDFWAWAGGALQGARLTRYKAGIARARRLWDTVVDEIAANGNGDRYFRYLEGPLLGHEHLLDRFVTLESAYGLYDKAARCQYDDPTHFAKLLEKSACLCEEHAQRFGPLLAYLTGMRRDLGMEQSSIQRLRAVRKNLAEIAAFLRQRQHSERPLPAFQQLQNVFMEPYRTNWYGDREHEWASEAPRFRRFSLRETKPITGGAPKADRE